MWVHICPLLDTHSPLGLKIYPVVIQLWRTGSFSGPYWLCVGYLGLLSALYLSCVDCVGAITQWCHHAMHYVASVHHHAQRHHALRYHAVRHVSVRHFPVAGRASSLAKPPLRVAANAMRRRQRVSFSSRAVSWGRKGRGGVNIRRLNFYLQLNEYTTIKNTGISPTWSL